MVEIKSKSILAVRLCRVLMVGMTAMTALLAAHDAAAEVFLRLDGIKGESQNPKFKDYIDVLSYTQSFRNTNTHSTGGGGGNGKVQCGSITVLKNIDLSSPELIAMVTTGLHIKRATLVFTSTTDRGVATYYRVTLTDVLVTEVDQTDNPDAGKIVEKIILDAATYRFEYRPQTAQGTSGPVVDFGFDCMRNREF